MTPEDFTTDPIKLYAEIDGQEVEVGIEPELQPKVEININPIEKVNSKVMGTVTVNIRLTRWQKLRLKFSFYKALGKAYLLRAKSRVVKCVRKWRSK